MAWGLEWRLGQYAEHARSQARTAAIRLHKTCAAEFPHIKSDLIKVIIANGRTLQEIQTKVIFNAEKKTCVQNPYENIQTSLIVIGRRHRVIEC